MAFSMQMPQQAHQPSYQTGGVISKSNSADSAFAEKVKDIASRDTEQSQLIRRMSEEYNLHYPSRRPFESRKSYQQRVDSYWAQVRSYEDQERSRNYNEEQQRLDLERQERLFREETERIERREDTSLQRMVEDAMKAGISPVHALGYGGSVGRASHSPSSALSDPSRQLLQGAGGDDQTLTRLLMVMAVALRAIL